MSSVDRSPLPPELAAPQNAFDVELLDVSPDLPPNELALEVQRWSIDGTGSAEWAMRHVVQAERAIDDLTAQAVEWYGRIDEWLANQSAPYRATLKFMSSHLERYALDVREADPKRKSVVLPSGKVQTTGKAAKVIVTDEPELIQWAQKHAPEIITERTVTSVGLTDLRSVVHPRKVWTLAWVTNSCGCKVSVRDDEGLDLPEIGTLVEKCSECGAEALIGRIEPLAYRWLAVTEDGAHVPGVDVQPDEVTAKVVLG